METVGAALLKGVDVEEVVEKLDSFYCYNMVVVQFCRAMENRLEGQTSFVLGDELEEVAEEALRAAKRLSERIGELGGEITADPSFWIERSPLPAFSMPESNSEVGVILEHVYERVRTIAREYGDFLGRVKERDELSHRLILRLLAEQVARASELEAALA